MAIAMENINLHSAFEIKCHYPSIFTHLSDCFRTANADCVTIKCFKMNRPNADFLLLLNIVSVDAV